MNNEESTILSKDSLKFNREKTDLLCKVYSYQVWELSFRCTVEIWVAKPWLAVDGADEMKFEL